MTPAALEGGLDLTAVLSTLREQEQKYGHSAESDRELPLYHFANELTSRGVEAGDVLRPGDRQDLDVAYRRSARLAALAIATMRRIRFEQAQAGSTDQ